MTNSRSSSIHARGEPARISPRRRVALLAASIALGAAALWTIQGPRFRGEARWPPPVRITTFPSSPAALEPAPGNLPRADPTSGPIDSGRAGMARIPAGDYWIGSASGAEDEQPRHAVRLEAFWIDVHEVTSVEFAAFVAATGYLTVAQRAGHAWVFDRERKAWRLGKNASWRLPDGREPAAPNEPVTQVCWSDAVAFARWAGKRLPSEAEWEAAAAGGLFDAAYPWGRELRPQGRYEANYWQGWFPDEDLGKDGFRGVAPIRSFRPNRYGLYDMAGNVAEWCADWHSEDYYQSGQMANPVGPAEGDAKVLRGGSWISAENAFRSLLCIYARQHLPPTVAREDVGFRCARDAETKPILK